MTIYQWYDVTVGYIEIKFMDTIDINTLINSNFVLKNTTSATPSVVSNPFIAIDVKRDYYSISRVLKLYWNVDLVADSTYRIEISNLRRISGAVLATDYIDFDTNGLDLATSEAIDPPSKAPADVVDYSIKDSDFLFAPTMSDTVSASLSIVSIKPDNDQAWYLDPSYNEGRIEITFNQPIAANYVSSQFFKVQRKLISSPISRWEDLTIIIGSNSTNNLVVIYLPSDDATPLYGEPDKSYWLDGYKYRLRVMGSVAAA